MPEENVCKLKDCLSNWSLLESEPFAFAPCFLRETRVLLQPFERDGNPWGSNLNGGGCGVDVSKRHSFGKHISSHDLVTWEDSLNIKSGKALVQQMCWWQNGAMDAHGLADHKTVLLLWERSQAMVS